MVFSNYFARVVPDLCTGCETCLERCQMDAFLLDQKGLAVVNKDRCIGCGLCVTTWNRKKPKEFIGGLLGKSPKADKIED